MIEDFGTAAGVLAAVSLLLGIGGALLERDRRPTVGRRRRR